MISLNTIIITTITGLRPLLGAVLGYIASVKTNAKSNQHALDLEKMRIEHEETIKKKERNRVLLEELCALVYGAHLDLATPFLSIDSFNDAAIVKSHEAIERVGVIVTLYYIDLIQVFGRLQESYTKLEQMNHELYLLRPTTSTINDPKVQRLITQINQESEVFGQRAGQFLKEIRKLAEHML